MNKRALLAQLPAPDRLRLLLVALGRLFEPDTLFLAACLVLPWAVGLAAGPLGWGGAMPTPSDELLGEKLVCLVVLPLWAHALPLMFFTQSLMLSDDAPHGWASFGPALAAVAALCAALVAIVPPPNDAKSMASLAPPAIHLKANAPALAEASKASPSKAPIPAAAQTPSAGKTEKNALHSAIEANIHLFGLLASCALLWARPLAKSAHALRKFLGASVARDHDKEERIDRARRSHSGQGLKERLAALAILDEDDWVAIERRAIEAKSKTRGPQGPAPARRRL